jgi:DNA polymerase-3 subunit alpha
LADFVHLHSHTHYSLLDGAGKVGDMVQRAANLGQKALAITDHGNMFGVLEFYKAAEKAGIKPIIGMEAYVAPKARDLKKKVEGESNNYHLVLLAKNEQGFKNLIKLSSIGYTEGKYHKPRIDKEILRELKEGLVASTACMGGEVPWNLRRGFRERAVKAAEWYMETFGDDYYFEIQDHHIPEEKPVYDAVYQLGKEMGIPIIATNDNHYVHKGDDEAHDVLMCLQTGKDRDDPNRMRYGTTELYLKSADEMYAVFKDRPEVLERTLEIEEKIDLKIDFSKTYMPEFKMPESESDSTADEYLTRITYSGAKSRYGELTTEIKDRIDHELSVIKKMGFAGYFLITADFIEAAKKRNIPVGLGRGSAAGSIVAYNIGITGVDPLKYGLLFERFLNPERVSMPDIDIDFCVERRDEVIEYVREKYGRKNVAQIVTFNTMASRAVIRDVSRVLKIPIPEADRIAKLVPIDGSKPMRLSKAFKNVEELREIAESDDVQKKELIKYSQTLEGIARNTSVHAAGVIITPEAVTNYAPLQQTSDGEITTQWTMGWSEEIGLLKMDFLGLRNLTVIQKTEKLISKRLGQNFSISDVPLNDEKTFKLFSEGATVGIFQFESSGMQEYLKKLKPSRIDDLVAMNALYRPGPMKMIENFVDRKFGKEKIEYLHPKLEPILEETYGVIVYQEQVMKISSDLAGFTMAQADSMRRAMGKKKLKEMAKQKKEFIRGCVQNKLNKKDAEEIFELIEKFAEYGFNKSHAVAYAIIAYQTGYLKAHYPAEFLSANLTSEVNNAPKVTALMEECRKLGLKVRPADVNYSEAYFIPIEKNVIAFGMAAIKNVGKNAINAIVKERKENGGAFKSLFEMMQKVDLRLVNKKVLESLAQAGALDSLEGNRAQLFYAVEAAIEFGHNYQSKRNLNKNQLSLFDHLEDGTNSEALISYPPLPDVPDWPQKDKLKKERELLGYYVSGHPLERYRTIVQLFSTNIDAILTKKDYPLPSNLKIAGQINSLRVILDRKNQKMAFVGIEDFKRTYEAVVFGSVYAKFEQMLKLDNIVYISGTRNSELTDEPIKIIANHILLLDDVPEHCADSVLLKLNRDRYSDELQYHLKQTLQSSPGNGGVFFEIDRSDGVKQIFQSKALRHKLTVNTLGELERILGAENIRIKVAE